MKVEKAKKAYSYVGSYPSLLMSYTRHTHKRHSQSSDGVARKYTSSSYDSANIAFISSSAVVINFRPNISTSTSKTPSDMNSGGFGPIRMS